MRAFTIAIRAPLACASRRKFGQNSVSAITINSGCNKRKYGRMAKAKSSGK